MFPSPTPLGSPTSSLAHRLMSGSDTICNSPSSSRADIVLFKNFGPFLDLCMSCLRRGHECRQRLLDCRKPHHLPLNMISNFNSTISLSTPILFLQSSFDSSFQISLGRVALIPICKIRGTINWKSKINTSSISSFRQLTKRLKMKNNRMQS